VTGGDARLDFNVESTARRWRGEGGDPYPDADRTHLHVGTAEGRMYTVGQAPAQGVRTTGAQVVPAARHAAPQPVRPAERSPAAQWGDRMAARMAHERSLARQARLR
jgi:hypothetical protein